MSICGAESVLWNYFTLTNLNPIYICNFVYHADQADDAWN